MAGWALGHSLPSSSRASRFGWLVWLPIGLATLAVLSEVLLSPAIVAIRPSAIGALATEETSRRFGALHALSIGLFLAIHAVSIALFIGHARCDARDQALTAAAEGRP